MKKLYYLSGIPRTGSTLLGSLLNQNPEIYVSPTSPLSDLLPTIDQTLSQLNYQYTYDVEQITYNIYSSILSNFYQHIDKKYIFDKHRSWTQNISSILKFSPNKPKVLVTYRPIPEVLTSYISLIHRTKQEDNFIDNALRSQNIPITNSNRADQIWRYYVSPSYTSVVDGLHHYPEMIHLVNYNNMIENPKKELEKIYEFLEIEPYNHNFESILNTCEEQKDDAWGLKGLHDIRSSLSKISENPIDVIGEENVKLYSKFNL